MRLLTFSTPLPLYGSLLVYEKPHPRLWGWGDYPHVSAGKIQETGSLPGSLALPHLLFCWPVAALGRQNIFTSGPQV